MTELPYSDSYFDVIYGISIFTHLSEHLHYDMNLLLDTLKDDILKKFILINYGTWERLNDNIPFISQAGSKPKGANFYPADITSEEFESFTDSSKNSQYTLIRRDESGKLISVPYHVAFKEQYSALEENKADVLGLFLVTALSELKETDANLMDNYTTFLAGIFRSIRFGASSAHGKANLIRFNYFEEKEVFSKNEKGKYLVDIVFEQGPSVIGLQDN